MQNVLTLESNKYAIKIDNFEGPLDLLCNLIEKNKMNIYDINLEKITDQYIELLNKAQELNLEVASEFLELASTLLYIKSKKLLPSKEEENTLEEMEEENLEITSEFLIMASTLLFIKSKGLLPSEVESEEELTEEQLIERIIEYKKYKEITKKLKENYSEFSKRFFKFAEEISLPKQKLDVKYEANIISEIYKKLIEKNEEKLNKNAKNIEKIAITETYTVGSKVKEMFRELIRRPKFVFNKLYSLSKCNKQEVVTAFTGLLELSRRSKVTTTQEELFGDITVEKIKRNV